MHACGIDALGQTRTMNLQQHSFALGMAPERLIGAGRSSAARNRMLGDRSADEVLARAKAGR